MCVSPSSLEPMQRIVVIAADLFAANQCESRSQEDVAASTVG